MSLLLLFAFSLLKRFNPIEVILAGCIFITLFSSLVFSDFLLVFIFFFISIFIFDLKELRVHEIIFFILVFSTLCFWNLSYNSAFEPLGERPRDFALLKEAYYSSHNFEEPWFSEHRIKYYFLWYAFFGRLGKELNLSLEVLYPISISLVASLVIFFTFKIFTTLGFSILNAITLSLVSFCLPNFATLQECLLNRCGDVFSWWRVSRVIKGGITEYPLWSMALGDLHPHYMSLAGDVYFLFRVIKAEKENKSLASFSLVILAFFYSLASNPWGVFFWLCFLIFHVIFKVKNLFNEIQKMNKRSIAYICIMSIWILGFIYFGINKLPETQTSIRLVSADSRTDFWEFLQHYGFQTLMLIITIFKYTHSYWFVAFLLLSFFIQKVYFLLIGLITIFTLYRTKEKFFKTLLASSLLVLSLPEIIFLDDPYGGEHERMNTIFKLYFSAWTPLTIIALVKLLDIEQKFLKQFFMFCLITVSIISLIFQFNSRFEPKISFYSKIESIYPKIQTCLRKLNNFSRGVVLEEGTSAYSWDSAICSISKHRCFLGWENHVYLLYNQNDEISFRKSLIFRILNSNDCSSIKEILEVINVNFILVKTKSSPLYSQKHLYNACLEIICDTEEYVIFKII